MLLRLATVLVMLASAGTAQAQAHTFKVIGQAGVLGEWELAGDLPQAGSAGEYAGPLTMTHTGICTQDGPPKKAVEMRLKVDAKATRVDATLLIDGVKCTYSGKKDDAFSGQLRCADRRDVPMLLWLR